MAVGEWSLWLGAIALAGIIPALINYAFYKAGKTAAIAAVCGTIAFLISLYPFFSALPAAREKNVSLSFGQYFSSLTGGKSNNNQSKTYVFKRAGETELKMDVYAPPVDVAANGAGVIVVHGGSWNAGERSDFPQWNVWLAGNGFMVFDIDYRLAPQPNYLSATGDVKCAVLWVKRNAAQFDISPDRIILLGRSAGAHLALMAAYSANDKSFTSSCEEAGDKAAVNENVRAVVSLYAPTDLLWSFDNPANQSVIDGRQTLARFLGGNPHESNEIRDRFLLASPTSRVNAQTPPTLLVHGGQDQLVGSENMNLLDKKLKEANISHKTIFLSYAQHGFDYNFNGWGAQVTKSVLLDFLRQNSK